MIPNLNMIKIMDMLRQGDPESIVMLMLQNAAYGNPLMQNLLSLAQQNKTQEIETIVRNMAEEKGIDFNKEFNSFKQMFGL